MNVCYTLESFYRLDSSVCGADGSGDELYKMKVVLNRKYVVGCIILANDIEFMLTNYVKLDYSVCYRKYNYKIDCYDNDMSEKKKCECLPITEPLLCTKKKLENLISFLFKQTAFLYTCNLSKSKRKVKKKKIDEEDTCTRRNKVTYHSHIHYGLE